MNTDAASVAQPGTPPAAPSSGPDGKPSSATPSTAPDAQLQMTPAARDGAEPRESSWRHWPRQRAQQVALVICTALVVTYVIATMAIRYEGMFDERAYDGDQPQAVWHYWRYHVDGAFPPGDLHTDYAFVMHAPPVWWLLMASMSTLITPLLAAKILNIVAYLGACVAIWLAVSRRSNAFVGLAAVLLLARNVEFSVIIAGGYARSFGPMLTLTFLWAFLAGKHRLTLAVLVLQAALYPSVVIPCGLAYGIYTVVAGPMRDRLRRMAGMFVAGLLIIAFGKFQDLRAPDWWGPLVTKEEAMQMPAWFYGGRVSELPLPPVRTELPRNLVRPFRHSGKPLLPSVGRTLSRNGGVPLYGALVGCIAVSWTLSFRRARRGERAVDPFPWQLPLLFACAFVSYLLARALFFKLYLPYRPLQHVWPYVVYAALPLAAWSVLVHLRIPKLGIPKLRELHLQRAAITALAVVLSVAPMYIAFGNGWEKGPRTYSKIDGNAARVYRWVQQQPLDALFAGEHNLIDRLPLFSWHRAYVMRNLAHPFRKAYYDEAERRIFAMYSALYADSYQKVIQFADETGVDFFVYRPNKIFEKPDARIFLPVRRDVERVFNQNRDTGFPMKAPPASSIVFKRGPIIVVSVEKLKETLRIKELEGKNEPGADDDSDTDDDTRDDANHGNQSNVNKDKEDEPFDRRQDGHP